MLTGYGCDTKLRAAFVLTVAMLATAARADGERAAYSIALSGDATLGLWSVWETGTNEYQLSVSLQPDAGPATPIRLYNLEVNWDATRLEPVGDPVPGSLFAGQPDSWFGHFDSGSTRTVTQTLLGDVGGVSPDAPVVLFTQLFHAIHPAGGTGLIGLGAATLRGPDNQEISVLASDAVNLTLDVTAPQGYLFDIVALNPAGNQAWTAQTLVASSLNPGDGSLSGLILSESAALPVNTSPTWQAPPAPTSYVLSSGNGLKTVRAWLRDIYGNRMALSDAITLDAVAPLYHVTQLQADPRHQSCLVTWNNPVAPDFDRVRLYRRGWSDDGLSRYPEYDDIDPMSPYPTTEAAALSAGFVLVYEGSGQSCLDAVVPRDVQRYVAFCLDHAGNPGPGNAAARDRSTNYLLGDTRTPWDGTVFVQDLVRLAGGYSSAMGEPTYDAQLDFGPTDDNSGEGIPLTDNLVGFEDLMIFALNYGPYGPALANAPTGPSADAQPRVTLETEGGLVRVRLDDGGAWRGLHLVLTWDGEAPARAQATQGAAAILQSSSGRLLLDRAWLPGEPRAGQLAELDFGPAGAPIGLRIAELDLR